MKPLFVSIFILSVLLFAFQARAERMTNDVYTATVLDLNKTKAGQNPLYDLGKNALNRRLLDKNLRTIGKVKNIVLTPTGQFKTVLSEITTSGFREDVSFDVSSYVIDPTPDSFTVAMDKSQIKGSMPKLMNGVETTTDGQGPLMLTSFVNAPVRKSDGTVVAKVQDTLVNTKSNQVIAWLVTVSIGTNRGKTIAIPYEATSVSKTGSIADLSVTDDQANIISTLATGR